ncbi:MAG: energy transducer TonB [Lewinellaceae bacterium]|nr:energy transducer TonB [Lewinellaceae bacterium]
MKHSMHTLMAIAILLCATQIMAQSTSAETSSADNKEMIYNQRDLNVSPSFPGGEQELMQYIATHINYPAEARKKGISGIVVIRFVVDANGIVRDGEIAKEIGGGCGEEALRMIGAMPAWTPGQVAGQAVASKYTLPIRFTLN